MHPLAPDLNSLKDEELHTKMAELQKRMTQCYKFGPVQIIPQLQMLMQDYQDEINRRNQQTMAELTKKSDKGNKGFTTIVDIQ